MPPMPHLQPKNQDEGMQDFQPVEMVNGSRQDGQEDQRLLIKQLQFQLKEKERKLLDQDRMIKSLQEEKLKYKNEYLNVYNKYKELQMKTRT